MNITLYIAAFLTTIVGVAHSYLGERYILVPLSRRKDLPKIFGSTEFTIRTLRFAWHITSIAWWGFAAVFVLLANPPVTSQALGTVVGITFLAHFVFVLVSSRGKHLSWVLFLIIGLIAIYASCSGTL
ncbi:MAG: hypothetical protein AB1521_03910 [Bacteroidota bacterium]